ncbi:SEC-C domain-containing protein [Yersinia enterocolitica]
MKGLGRNELCWCGSEIKYKKCHLNRGSAEELPQGQFYSELKNKGKHYACLHPDASDNSCSKRIINAHTVQKNGPLKRIINSENNVLCFSFDASQNYTVKSIGWNKASTFTGFCGHHDKEMFSIIEDSFFCDNEKQCFISGYRSFSMEYFKKLSVLKSIPYMKDNADKGKSFEKQKKYQHTLDIMNHGFSQGMNALKSTLDDYAKSFRINDFSSFNSLSIHFSGELNIAATFAFSPDFSLDGERQQYLLPGSAFIENLSVTVLLTDVGFAWVFSWPKSFTCCTKFIQSLIELPEDEVASTIIDMIFSYSENVYFSSNWWNGLDIAYKNMIIHMANKVQYSKPLARSGINYTNWIFEKIEINIK